MCYEWFLGITVVIVMVSLFAMLRGNQFVCNGPLCCPKNFNKIENGFIYASHLFLVLNYRAKMLRK